MKIKKDIVDKFDKLLIEVAKNLFNDIMCISDSEFYFQDYYICRQENNLYSICTRQDYNVLYSDIFLFSAAIAIANNLHKKNISNIEKLFHYDSYYATLYQKMKTYSNSKKWDLYENCRIDADYILERIHDDIFSEIG
jgi:hypothetical protein